MGRVPSTIRTQGSSTALQSIPTRSPGAPIEQIGDRQLLAVQQAAKAETATARALPFGDGNLFEGIVFGAATTVVIKHGLGAKFRGYLILNWQGVSSPTITLVANSPTALDSKQIQLVSGNAGTASVWVYK